jgi:hypothetical protein
MTPESFTSQLCAWIPASAIIQASQRLQAEPQLATSPSKIVLQSQVLKSVREAAYIEMLEEFLSHFQLAPTLIEHAESIERAHCSENSRTILTQLRFEGSLSGLRANSSKTGATKLAVVSERDFMADLLLWPLRMLTDLVSGYAKYWRRAKQKELNVFLMQSSDGSFAASVERRVARAYGFDVGAFGQNDFLTAKYNYRSATLLYTTTFVAAEPSLLNHFRALAVQVAGSTLAPLPEHLARKAPHIKK